MRGGSQPTTVPRSERSRRGLDAAARDLARGRERGLTGRRSDLLDRGGWGQGSATAKGRREGCRGVVTRDRDGNGVDDQIDLNRLADRAFVQRGFVHTSPEAEAEALSAAPDDDPLLRDLRHLLWSSIDNESSRDLDQVEYCEALEDGAIRLYVGIAEVSAYLREGARAAALAEANTTTVYTAAGVFPMLPRALSEDRTSLLPGVARRAMVTVLTVDAEGAVQSRAHFPAVIQNRAKLVYEDVSAWLDGGPPPRDCDAALLAQLLLQMSLAERLEARKNARGALGFSSRETELLRDDAGHVVDIIDRAPTRAGRIVENFMLVVNQAVAETLADAGVSCIRRVVRPPPRWARLRELAASVSYTLPAEPEPQSLARWLAAVEAHDPANAAQLSLAVRKLIGSGEYLRWRPGDAPLPHFALAVDAYAHSTAPNRRLPDIVVQRSLHAVLRGAPPPFSDDALDAIAARCTERSSSARKVERQIDKSAAALFLSNRVGDRFDAVVSGSNGRGVWVKLPRPAVEGRLVAGFEGVDVGETVAATLVSVDVRAGYLDFARFRRAGAA